MPDHVDVLAGFHPAVRAWFTARFTAPSPPQLLGWPAIRAGQNVLILAATGTGKTLAAFLEVLSRLYSGSTGQGVQVVYVSPLKALNNDVARNLTEPLRGIAQTAQELGLTVPEITVAVRTGDTPQSARRTMLRKPPDILITTPESLYLMLSSPKARSILSPAHTIIVDEIHALAGSKRGVHLALSIERLEHLAGRPLQRIGLSATQRPLELIAHFLGGEVDHVPRPVQVLDARQAKEMTIRVQVGPDSLTPAPGHSIWPDIYARVWQEISAHRSTLVFTNTRAMAERLAMGINDLAGDTVARTHHGSLSRQAREQVEAALKAGELRALVCTSTLELGIDVGAVDFVVQIASPRSVSSGLQRIGRSGHVLGAASEGVIFAKAPDDLLDAAWVAREMRKGEVEATQVPENCLDVLAQHIVSMVGCDTWTLSDLLTLAQRSYPFRHLSRAQLLSVVEMLAGRYPARDYIELRPKIAWDRVADTLQPLPGTRAAAVAGAGTIPDRAYYPVYLAGQDVRIGELEEEFVSERRTGDAFILGNSIWRINAINDHRVVVSPAPGAVPNMPFWNGDKSGRGLAAGRRLGAFWRELAERLPLEDTRKWLADETGLDAAACDELLSYLAHQQEHTGCIPTDRCLLLETYTDQAGDYRIVLHSPYGYRIHAAWEMATRRQVREEVGYDIASVATDYGIAWHVPRGQEPPPLDALVYLGESVEQRLMQELPASALFGAHFRMNAARSLVLGRSSPRKRVPLWLQRLKAGDLLAMVRQESSFPVALETFRECLQEVLDVPGLVELQQEIAAERVRVEYRQTIIPSPFAQAFVLQLTASYMYADDTPRAERKAQFLSLDRELLQEMLGEAELRDLLAADAIAATVARRQRLSAGLQARNADELEEVLLDVGDLSSDEIEQRITDIDAFHGLLATGRMLELSFPVAPHNRYIAAEERSLYETAYGAIGPAKPAEREARAFLLRRYARTHGPFVTSEPAKRFGWDVQEVQGLLENLQESGFLQSGAFLPEGTGAEWCHRDVLQEVHRRSLAALRQEVEDVGARDFTRHLLHWQGVGRKAVPDPGPQALAQILEQLAGLFLPVEVWERDILPARLPGYSSAWLDLLCARGEFSWVMQPGGSPDRGRLAFFRREDLQLVLPLILRHPDTGVLSETARMVERLLERRGAAFANELAAQLAGSDLAGRCSVHEALWELALAGRVTNDTFDPVRKGKPQAEMPAVSRFSPARPPYGRATQQLRRAIQQRVAIGLSTGGGRWSLLPQTAPPQTDAAREASPTNPSGAGMQRLAEILLGRWGVVTRDMLAVEGLEFLWQEMYRTLQVWEMTGQVRGGYFVSGLSGTQFACPDAVEALRQMRNAADGEGVPPVLLNACDPACAAVSLFPGELPGGAGFTRSPLHYAALIDGALALYVSGFGKNLWSPVTTPSVVLEQAISLLPRLLGIPGHQRPRRALAVSTFNAVPVLETPIAAQLGALGFTASAGTLVLWPSRLRRPAAGAKPSGCEKLPG